MRNLTMFFSKKAFYALILLVLVGAIACVAFVSGGVACDNSIVANAALTANGTTKLSHGNGMQYGANILKPNADDFYHEGTGAISYTGDSIALSGQTVLITKPGIITATTTDYSNFDPNALVFYGLVDKDTTTVFNFEISLKGTITSAFDINVDMYYANGATADSIVESSRIDVDPYYVGVSDSYSNTIQLQTSVSGVQRATGASHLYVKLSFDAGSSTIYVSNAMVSVSVESAQIGVNAEKGINLTISGANRNTVVIPDVLGDNGRAMLDSVYIKAGDKITLDAGFSKTTDGVSDNSHKFSTTYAAAFNRIGMSCVDWYSYYDNQYGKSNSHLTRIEDEQLVIYPDGADQQRVYKENVYNGFTASFIVQSSVTNAKTIQIVPRLLRSYNGNTYTYWSPASAMDAPSLSINLKVDNKAPSAPKLDMTEGLGLAIKENKWYTAAREFKLKYDESTLNTNSDVAYESIYAFVVEKNFSTLQADYDFTPGNGEYYQYIVGGESYEAQRQELGLFSNTASSDLRQNIDFGMAGEYGLVLYAVDNAGNVSSPTLYTESQGHTVKVDWNTKGVGIHISYGNNPELEPSNSNRLEFQKYCTVYAFQGDAYHDAEGNCIQPLDDNPSAASTLRNLLNVKRGVRITLRIVMDATQAYNYSLVRLGSTFLQYDNPTYEIDRFGNRVYQYTYTMTDTIWEYNPSSSVRATTAFFHRRVDLKLLDDDFTFDYTFSANKIEFADRMQAYFADGSETITMQPTIIVEYLKPQNISIIGEYAMVGSQMVLQGAGTIVINGVSYDYDASFDANEFGRGKIPFITGAEEYYVMDYIGAETRTDGDRNIATVTLKGYDKNAGSLEGFRDAGDYYYHAYVKQGGNTFYYGEITSRYTVKKANPDVIDAFAKNELTYGDSLGELIFASYSESGLEIPQTNTITFAGKTYIQVNSGVYGQFVILVPQIGSPDYEKHPVAESYTITVEFQPMDLASLTTKEITDNYSVLERYFAPVLAQDGSIIAYTLREGMQCSTNYESVTIDIAVKINHKYATVLATTDSLNTVYDGHDKSIVTYVYTNEEGVNVELNDIPVIVEYKMKGEGDGSYTRVLPVNAGEYDVRMSIDSTATNYFSDFSYDSMFISARPLEISVEESVKEYQALSQEEVIEGQAVNGVLTYTYSYTQTATYLAGYYDQNSDFQKVTGILYEYTLLKYAYYDLDMNIVEIENPVWGDTLELIGGSSLDAGLYLMEVKVNNQNNAGTLYLKVDVKQVRRGDAAALNISMPSTQANYQTVNLDGSSNGRTGHLEFGQTLESMVSTVIGRGGSAKFTPRGALSPLNINSRFIFETEENYVTRTLLTLGYLELETNGRGEKVLPVRYNEAGTIMPYSIMVIWQAGTVDGNGEFQPNYNFRAESFEVNIYVVRAQANFDEYRLSTLTYGQKVSEAQFEGTITSHGYTFKPTDYTITIPTETLSYVPQGGENDILCSFKPSAELERKFAPLNNVPIALTVEKREINIGFDRVTITPDDYDGNIYLDGVKQTYATQYQNPTTTLRAVKDVNNIIRLGVDTDGYYQVSLLSYNASAVYLLDQSGNKVNILSGTLYATVGTSRHTFHFGSDSFSIVDGSTQATYSGDYFYNAVDGSYDIKQAITLSTSGVHPQFTFYRDFVEGETLGENDVVYIRNGVKYVQIDTISASTPVGRYYVKAQIVDSDKNFKGENFNTFFVVRSELFFEGGSLPQVSIEYSENINSVDFGSVMVVNNPNNYNKFFRGTFSLAVMGDDGELVYDYLPPVTVDNSEYNAYIVFTPVSDDQAVIADYNNNFRPYVVEYFLRVDKRDISSTFIVENLTQTFDNRVKEISVTIPDPVNAGQTLPYVLSDMSGCIGAGEYTITISMDDSVENYTGSLDVTLTIEKAELTLLNLTVEKAYDAQAFVFEPEYTVALPGFQNATYTFNIEYKDYLENPMGSAPVAIGMYYADVTLVDDNFAESETITMLIAPNYDGYTGLNQTYVPANATESIVPVAPAFNKINIAGELRDHPSVNYTVEYKEKGLGDDYYHSMLPIHAGEYDARVTISERGYYKRVVLDMVIEKREVEFDLLDRYYATYTGYEIDFGTIVTLPATVAYANYTYVDASGNTLVGKPTNSGDYMVTIEIVDIDYKGTATVPFTINKAMLNIANNPLFDGTVEFNMNKEDVKFNEAGAVVTFAGLDENLAPYGHFEVKTDISSFRAGTHNIEVNFVPDGDFALNFSIATTTMNIQIATRNIQEFIAFADENVAVDENSGLITITYEYIFDTIGVHPYIKDEANLIAGYTDIGFEILYAGVPKLPTNVGEYNVSVKVSDANYSGMIQNVLLKITPASPVVELPEINDIKMGDKLDNSYIKPSSGGAYIASNLKPIQGTFTVMPEYRVVMNKANEQEILLLFTPLDRNNVVQLIVEATINVVGNDIDITEDDIVVTPVNGADAIVYYGAKLSEYSISLTGTVATLGEVRWANPDRVLRVGEQAEYIFTPYDTDNYNIKTLVTSKAVIAKSDMLLGTGNYVIAYEGQTVSEADVTLNIFNANYPDIRVEGYTYEILVNGPSLPLTPFDLGKYLDGVTVTIKVYHPDYNDNSNSVYEFPVYVVRKIDDFSIQNSEKFYDTLPVTMADLGVTLVGTDYTPSIDELEFQEILLDGKKVAEIRDAGTYQVTIRLNELEYSEGGTILGGAHVGAYTFTYKVLKRDISDALEITGNNLTYADVSQKLQATFGEYQVDSSTIQYTYYSENKSMNYGALPPTDAGNYKVVVSISSKNPYYTATGEFDYIIHKRVATVTFDASYSYTYNPNQPISIVPEVSNNVSLEYIQIMYYVMGQANGTTEVPVNVGTYRVVANIVNHPNISGRGETILDIRQASVTISQIPSIDAISYGVMLKHAGIHGGIAEATNGTVLDGTFSFAEPELNTLNAGINTITLVFTPQNSNYAKATCFATIRITKAVIGVEFKTLAKYYTGSPLTPDVDTDSNINIIYSFRQNGLNVQNAVGAGIYEVTATIDNLNYAGSATTTFTIYKAQAVLAESTLPLASDLSYGQYLGNSTISGGSIVYVSGQSGVYGSFKYVQEDTVLGDVKFDALTGEIAPYMVDILFTPEDTANYELTVLTVPVKVVKASATMTVSANSFVYGDTILSPVFTTYPAGLNVDNSEFENAIGGTIQRAGTYQYTAYINENNYTGSYTYAIFVIKKAIQIDFRNGGVSTDAYHSEYGIEYYPSVQIIQDTLVGDDATNYIEYGRKIIFRYTNNATGESKLVPPTQVGEYTVTAVLDDNDYLIDSNYASVPYVVYRATVSELMFESESLSNQIYGSVSMPLVSTTPANVGYEIEFPGYENMPTNAGTYSIKVTITDPNYNATTLTAMFRINPKQISLRDFKAYNKAYDGLGAIEVKADLEGVMRGDEVDVKLIAETEGNKANIGVHKVVITSWELVGLHARNYTLVDPIYNLSATITNKVITDPNTSSYITSENGFSSNVTVSFEEVYDTVDQTTWFTKMLGQKATVQVISVKENGLNTVLDSKVKFYVRIPDEYVDAENLTVEGIGNLEGIIVTREGDYVTFYADSSGEIVFYKNDFPYWIIPVLTVVAMIVIGAIFALIALPLRKRKHLPRDARKAYEWNQGLEGREHAYKKKVEQEIVEKKRRWRY